MKIKGLDKLQEKIPVLKGKRFIFLPLYVLSMVSLSLYILIKFYSLPERIGGKIGALFPLLGEVVISIAGYFLIYQMWYWRDKLKARYGKLSYQKIFLSGFTGISLFFFSIPISMFLPFWKFAPLFWEKSKFKFLATVMDSSIGSGGWLIHFVRIPLSILFFLVGILLIFRSLQTFGADYMSVVYLYFPEESKVQHHEIYSILRHPTYAGLILIALGGTLFSFTPYSIIFFLIYVGIFYFHIYFVEERELIERFGDSYKKYMKEVPAFFVNPKKIKILIRFLLGREG